MLVSSSGGSPKPWVSILKWLDDLGYHYFRNPPYVRFTQSHFSSFFPSKIPRVPGNNPMFFPRKSSFLRENHEYLLNPIFFSRTSLLFERKSIIMK